MARQGYPERPDEKREERGFNTEHTERIERKIVKERREDSPQRATENS